MDKYTGKDVGRAGNVLRDFNENTSESEDDFKSAMKVLSYWRHSHETPLVEAMDLVRQSVSPICQRAVFAKRPKRIRSIINKLQRFEKMSLRTMNDIGGCRVILANEKKLRKAIKAVKRHSKHFKLAQKIKFKDYIETPKEDGYRGYHLIGKFGENKNSERFIEIQFRTVVQHSWATAVEIVDIFTNQALKSNSGDENWAIYFQHASKLLAVIESSNSSGNHPPDALQKLYHDAISQNASLSAAHIGFHKLEKKLDVHRRFEAFAGSLKAMENISELEGYDGNGYVLLTIDTNRHQISANVFDITNGIEAERCYIEAELESRDDQGIVVALVSAVALGGIKEAYPNYFADATVFRHGLDLILSVKVQGTFISNTLNILSKAKLP